MKVSQLALDSLFLLEICNVTQELVCSFACPTPFLTGFFQIFADLRHHSVTLSVYFLPLLTSEGFVEKMKMVVRSLGRCLL